MSEVAAIRHWKPSDIQFTDHDKEVIAAALGMDIEQIRWEVVDHEICGDVVGHAIVGYTF
jgi:hypothetical protein